MKNINRESIPGSLLCLVGLFGLVVCGCSKPEQPIKSKPQDHSKKSEEPMGMLTHQETLAWIKKHHAWKRVRKTKPIWAREITPEELGKEFQTADQAVEKANGVAWLCVGVANEPWFQKLEKIEAKYERGIAESRKFSFDEKAHQYFLFKPKPDSENWAARILGDGITEFSIHPSYDPQTTLRSPVGGYVVKGDVKNPYEDKLDEVWLVQKTLFESTYEFLPDKPEPKDSGRTKP